MLREGTIILITNPIDGKSYDGVIWAVVNEDESDYSIFVRYIDSVD